ncbi:DEAD/DEAH box helicase [Ferrimicrobium sp.]|uniref:DEAD/DEAH box helicase n=1 Tax=Ferrimicrobium sp. TaxID=2926050 RepID=UPI00260E1EFA|nr:DEAD/DEAH box helicase [Ferrimicrobium sp.]
MTVSPIAAAILSNESTATIRMEIARHGVLHDFGVVRSTGEQFPIDWPRALSLASALTAEDDEAAQDLALRIAQGCLLADDTLSHHRNAAVILLERMGNLPSLSLAVDRGIIPSDSWTRAPTTLQLDVVRRRLELTIPVTGSGVVKANPFQRRFWDAAQEARWVSVSAPTSAGKSYIVRRWFEECMADRERFTGIYVVPTRALIEEVSGDLSEQFVAMDVGIYSVPWDAEIEARRRKILVLTQERLHLLQQRLPAEGADLLFVDEAQKFGDGARGVLLQQTIEEGVRRNPASQVIFASPLSSNPELLLEGAGYNANIATVSSDWITVNQNLIWVDQVPRRPTLWKLQLVLDSQPSDIGEFDLPARPQPDSKRLPLVAVALGKSGGGNVVYVNGAADAERTALQIYEALGSDADISYEQGIVDLRELIQKTIHPQYALATVVLRGVAFHYGNMPLPVRTEIERLFRSGTLNYLVCTSTLLEGVNLPCRNLFARNPKKGNGTPMSAADFWNLAGRAGRWGQEFQGNIVCVDANRPRCWTELPTSRKRQPMTRATQEALADVGAVVAYIDGGAPLDVARANPMLEALYSYLAARVISGAGLSNLPKLTDADAQRLELAIRTAVEPTDIDVVLLERHSGISPAAMQRLLERFRTYDNPDDLVLAPPESSDAVDNYQLALNLANQELGAAFGEHSRQIALAILITNWMRGTSLAKLIDGRIGYLQRNNRPYKLPKEIRDVMHDVEQVARFQGPKYLACYTDVLFLHLRQQGREVTSDLPDISMMLELGVSRVTEVSLMVLGLSRTSAVALSEFIVPDSLSREEVTSWVNEHRDVLNELPALVRREIEMVFDRYSSSS